MATIISIEEGAARLQKREEKRIAALRSLDKPDKALSTPKPPAPSLPRGARGFIAKKSNND